MDKELQGELEKKIRDSVVKVEARKMLSQAKKEIIDHIQKEVKKKPFLNNLKKMVMRDLEMYLEDGVALDILTKDELNALHRKAVLSVLKK